MYMQLYIEHNDSSVVLKKLFVTHIQSTYVSLNAFISWTNKQYTILLHKVEQNIDLLIELKFVACKKVGSS